MESSKHSKTRARCNQQWILERVYEESRNAFPHARQYHFWAALRNASELSAMLYNEVPGFEGFGLEAANLSNKIVNRLVSDGMGFDARDYLDFLAAVERDLVRTGGVKKP